MARYIYEGQELPKYLPLTDLPIGARDENQVLVAKEGDLQLWKNEDTQKFGVYRIKDDKTYTIKNADRAAFDCIVGYNMDEATTREVFLTMACGSMTLRQVRWIMEGK